jgi:Fe-S-cluster containining protein
MNFDENSISHNIKGDNTPTKEQGCIRRGLCCKNNPGWFAPGEVEKAADFLKMSTDQFIRSYLLIDGIHTPEYGWIDVFVPARLNRFGEFDLPPLSRVDDIYRFTSGPCVFYHENGCDIYPVRPIECRSYFCGNDPSEDLSHEEIAKMWAEEKVPEDN